MYICIYICNSCNICIYIYMYTLYMYMYTLYLCIYMYICMFVCIYIYIWICILDTCDTWFMYTSIFPGCLETHGPKIRSFFNWGGGTLGEAALSTWRCWEAQGGQQRSIFSWEVGSAINPTWSWLTPAAQLHPSLNSVIKHLPLWTDEVDNSLCSIILPFSTTTSRKEMAEVYRQHGQHISQWGI